MSNKGPYTGPLEKVNDYCWRIPKSYREGMRVDGLIFADEQLLEHIRADQAPEQVANVAFLPGIQYASLAMPDIHWGYGFCIGGVAATDPTEGGVISPGGVGYDINCLSGDTPVLHAHGYTRRIGEMAEVWREETLACFDLQRSRKTAAQPYRWFGQKPKKPVLRMTTVAGDTVRATADHPFWTPAGMIELGRLQPGDRIAMAPFEGVEYEPPTDAVLVSEQTVCKQMSALGVGASDAARTQVLNYLRKRGLLPLRYSSPAMPYLCKLVGAALGMGKLNFATHGQGVVTFYGEAEDLERMRADLAAIGVTPSRIRARQRAHAATSQTDNAAFARWEHFHVMNRAFAVLLACLGVPQGDKARQDYEAPAWLFDAPRWQQRLFLAALFGAKLTVVSTLGGCGAVFTAPALVLTKREPFVASGRRFLEQIRTLLQPFGVETQTVAERQTPTTAHRERAVQLRLIFSSKAESLLHLWSRIGLEYNAKRQGRAALAVQYLKHKRRHAVQREETQQLSQVYRKRDAFRAAAGYSLANANDNSPHAACSREEGCATVHLAVERFPTFSQFCRQRAVGDLQSGMVWEEIESIEPVEDYDELVYDFTVNHPDHNFVAGGFVVSNCGVRLVRSNIHYQDIKPHMEVVMDQLFRHVPAGVGKGGVHRYKGKELKRLMREGPRALIKDGMATEGDIAHTEAHGCLERAEPDLVSERALARGEDQVGTLGSGNHFLEVQIVEAIYDEEAARVMGLEKDMVCVMIHSGSRGLGYQVCDDALKKLRGVPEKYGIYLPDRQLACAPIESKEGQEYIGAMCAAANFAWCNRQVLMHLARTAFEKALGKSWQSLQMNLVYDVAHNIAKYETHTTGGKERKVWVHRKGATRAFPPYHPETPDLYKQIGQPVIIPGDMGRASFVLVGQPGSMEQSFGTTCHGAGRALSRTAAVKAAQGRKIEEELRARGVIALAHSWRGLAEEQPEAYKDVNLVVDVVHQANLAKKVARMKPIGVVKG